MRTSEERLDELHRRMDKRTRDKKSRDFMLRSAAVCIAGLAITVACAFLIAKAPYRNPGAAESGIPGSIIATRSVLGYIVIGIIAFALGIAVTVFCYQIKKYQTGNDEDAGSIDKRRDIL